MTLSRKERLLRNEMDKSFRPLFDPHEQDGGIELKSLAVEIQQNSKLPRTRVDYMLKKADRDTNGRITYKEFVTEMTQQSDEMVRRLTNGQRFKARMVMSVMPGGSRRRRIVDADETDIGWGEGDAEATYLDQYDCCPPPLFIPLITLAEIAVFVYYALLKNKDGSGPLYPTGLKSGAPVYSPLIWNPVARIEFWRFLTYMFLHNGLFHLVFNCFVQLVLGILLETVHKWWRVGAVYLLGVVAGSLAHSIFDPYVAVVGASGGCYALMGAHFAILIINWNEMQRGWLDNPINFLSSAVFRLGLMLLLVGGDTGMAVWARYSSGASSVGFAAHGGGFIAGILVGVSILRNITVHNWERVLRWVFVVVYLLFMVAAVLFNAFCGGKLCCTSVPFNSYKGEAGSVVKFEPAASCEKFHFREWLGMGKLSTTS